MNVYEIKFKYHDSDMIETDIAVAEDVVDAMSLVNKNHQSRFGFDPTIVETKLVKENVLIKEA